MKQADVAVIGGGILGCFVARSLMRWKLSVILLEKEPDVCTGITRANSAIVYAGYDNRPGSRKAAMTVAGNRNFDTLCRELDVPFSRCGSLMVTYDEKSLPRLRQKLENGLANGVPGLQMLSEGQVRQMEPALTPGVAGALYAPSTGTVNPWSLGIAAFENGVRNGVVPMLSTGVTHIKSWEKGYVLQTNRGDIACKAVINCAGLYADQVQEMLFPPDVRLHWDGADYLVLDRSAAKPGHIIFEQAEACGKGITLIPCVEGNLLLSGMRSPSAEVPFATTAEGLAALKVRTKALLPELAKPLKEAAVSRVNLSVDTLNPEKYAKITRNGNLEDFWRGFHAALDAGFRKIKLNAVLIGGVNDDEILPLAQLTREYPVDMRFIEMMPMCDSAGFGPEAYIPYTRVLQVLEDAQSVAKDGGVAKLYRLPGAQGNIGLISPVSDHFCAECNRIRLTADGKVKPCLHSNAEYPLKGLDFEAMRAQLEAAIYGKPRWHGDLDAAHKSGAGRAMNQIGG